MGRLFVLGEWTTTWPCITALLSRVLDKRMSTNPRYNNGHRRRKLRESVARRGEPCHICHLPIDYSLPAGDPMSFELDELVPVSRGGDPLDPDNVAPAHRICNQKRGNRMTNDFRQGHSASAGLPQARQI